MPSIIYKNTKINFTDSGKGTAIVLLHGFLENSSMWDFYIPALSSKFRVIAIDLLGHGDTECMGYIHSMEDMADAVQAVLSELRIRKSVFVGHSMGGYVALAFAELYPDNIKGLVLLNSTARADSDERKLNRDRAIKAVKQSHTNFISLAIGNLFNPEHRDAFQEEIENIKFQALKIPLQGIVAALEGMKTRNDREVLLHFAPYPMMIILGKKDPVLNYNETVEQIEGTAVKLVSFPDGHMSSVENRAELLETLLLFFKKI
ncbi:alpha/beta fold hydrolase [Flavobacterium sp. '19STA2R22 D10 B1']|uniref:alpha/beta fold hydrolase n=1 Tax=Flavobacterium aerium TaxID=3037261 RepID=UPI00278C3964|nr:alpha/beta hydrolase [Flavobacterium sp. '19STA2R22 D10 B1']